MWRNINFNLPNKDVGNLAKSSPAHTSLLSPVSSPPITVLSNFFQISIDLKSLLTLTTTWLNWLELRSFQAWNVCRFQSSQGTYLGYGFGPWLRCIQGATNPCFFLSLPFPLPISLKTNGNRSSGENKKITISKILLLSILCTEICDYSSYLMQNCKIYLNSYIIAKSL